jgi:hypothetical protein
MKKLHKIIAIPIQEKSIILKQYDVRYHLSSVELEGDNKDLIPQQLLLLSNEEIKENANTFKEGINGDWFYNTKFQSIQRIGDITDFDFKIIASYPQLDNLPTFSKEFIQEWCKNPVEEIEVQYDSHQEYKGSKPFIKQDLILTSNNEVICTISNLSKVLKESEKIAKKALYRSSFIESHSDQVINQMNADRELEETAEEHFSHFNNSTRSNYWAVRGFVAGVKSEVAKKYHTQRVHTEEDIVNFAQWYSGMDKEKVKKAYQRYLVEQNKKH